MRRHDCSTRSATVYNNGAAAAVYPGSEARKSAPLVFARRLPGRFPAAAARLERTPTPLLPPLHSYRTRGCPSIGVLSSLSLLLSLSRRVLHKRTPPLAAQPYFCLTHRNLFYSEMIWKRVAAPSPGGKDRDFMTKHVAATLACLADSRSRFQRCGMGPLVLIRTSSDGHPNFHRFCPCFSKSFERISTNLTKDKCVLCCWFLRFLPSRFPTRHRFINWPLENCNPAF